MQLRNENQTSLAAEIQIVPAWAWILAAIGFICMQFVFNVTVAHQHDAPPAWARPLLGLLVGIVTACFLLFIGYINRDAKRRGMSPLLWTVIAILIPNALGIILYFVLRQPLRSACPQCGYGVQKEFNLHRIPTLRASAAQRLSQDKVEDDAERIRDESGHQRPKQARHSAAFGIAVHVADKQKIGCGQ